MLQLEGKEIYSQDAEILYGVNGEEIGAIYRDEKVVQITPGFFVNYKAHTITEETFDELKALYEDIGDFQIRRIKNRRIAAQIIYSKFVEKGEWLSDVDPEMAAKKWEQFLSYPDDWELVIRSMRNERLAS